MNTAEIYYNDLFYVCNMQNYSSSFNHSTNHQKRPLLEFSFGGKNLENEEICQYVQNEEKPMAEDVQSL